MDYIDTMHEAACRFDREMLPAIFITAILTALMLQSLVSYCSYLQIDVDGLLIVPNEREIDTSVCKYFMPLGFRSPS